MANMREVNKAIKAAHPELKVEVVRGNGYVYFDGEGFDEIPSIYSNPVGTSTPTMIRMCLESVSEYARIKALAAIEAEQDAIAAIEEAPAPDQQHHFFAGTRCGWAVSDDYEEAIKAAAAMVGEERMRNYKRLTGGITAVVCRVELPIKAHYTISNYVPNFMTVDGVITRDLVPISNTDTIRITETNGKWIYA